jgi:hypothetical protein
MLVDDAEKKPSERASITKPQSLKKKKSGM